MNRLKSAVLVLIAVAVASSMLLIPNHAGAQGSAALSIVPRKDYTVEPGKTVNDTITVSNQDRERPLNVSMRAIDFTYLDQTGAPKLLLAEDIAPTEESLRSFMTLPESMTIEPGGSASIDLSITMPANQGGGSYYSAIIFSSSSSEGGNVGLSASTVTLVFAEVPGEARQNLDLKRLGALEKTEGGDGTKYSYFHTQMPSQLGYTLLNEGNVTGRPHGSITLKPLFGKEVLISQINPGNSLALIGQERLFSACIQIKGQEVDFGGSRSEATTCAEPGLWPGFYKVSLAGFYGRNGSPTKDLNGSSWFIYAPWWFILVLVVVLSFVGYHVWKIVRHIRSRGTKTRLKKQPRR